MSTSSSAAWIFALMLLAGVCAAQDSELRNGAANFLHPRSESSISERDEVFVLYTDGCGANELNPEVAPRVRIEADRMVVELTIRLTSNLPFCFAAPPPARTWVIPLGTLTKGDYLIERRIFQPTSSGAEPTLLASLTNTLHVGDTPHPSVSGTWYDRSAPGTGYIVTLIPSTDGSAPQAMLFSATLDAQQRPTWLLGVGRFVNAWLNVDAAPGGNSMNVQQLSIEYRGCGRLTLVDRAFPTFFTDLAQLTTVAGVEACAPVGERLLPQIE